MCRGCGAWIRSRGNIRRDPIRFNPALGYGITNNMKINMLSWPREPLASEFSEGPRRF